MRSTRVAIAIVAIVAIGLLAHDARVRADAAPERPVCPSAPHDGASCGAFHAGATCRYPRRGVICACQRLQVEERRRLIWSCGELGE